ncbi:MAG: hypothetical protein HY822_21910 [Acidobacteria bacterium]|nr:hypothetical protein [Acidobacteriota bacterium]
MTRREALLAAASPLAVSAPPGGMPRVRIGKHEFSRLMAGGNPVSGNSHQPGRLSREMRDYFTAENVKKMLRACEQAGINTWQSRADRHIMRLLNEYRLEGGQIQWVAQTASELADIPRNIRECAGLGAAGVYHHGSSTDSLWAAGRIQEVRERLKVMRDAGVLVGLGTHIPAVIDHAEEKAWDVDFYMTCIYNLSRTKEEASRVAGRPVEGEFFWEPDRVEMLKRVKQTRKPCLIFKVYGAGRRCGSAEDMRAALRQVFEYAKPSDCLVVGMFPKHKEQVRENCALVREAL